MTSYQSSRNRRPRQLPPLRVCDGCGERFRSWADDRYCGRKTCVELRLFGPAGDGELETPEPRGVPFNEFPPGF